MTDPLERTYEAFTGLVAITELRAEVERLRAENAELFVNNGDAANLLGKANAEVERLRLRVKFLEDELKCPAALEPKLNPDHPARGHDQD